jgi:hypothetical protein
MGGAPFFGFIDPGGFMRHPEMDASKLGIFPANIGVSPFANTAGAV